MPCLLGPGFRFLFGILKSEDITFPKIDIFSFTRGVCYVNNKVLLTIEKNVHKYVTKRVDIRKAPSRHEDNLRWCDEIYEARGQIGLICEDSTVKSGIDWSKGAEGSFCTETK